MPRIASLLCDALAYLVFFGIRIRLGNRDLAELLGDEYFGFSMLIIRQVADPRALHATESNKKGLTP